MKAGNLLFSSNFDSGNLAAVELVMADPWEPVCPSKVLEQHWESFRKEDDGGNSSGSEGPDPTESVAANIPRELPAEQSGESASVEEIYQLWIASDCAGTEHETKNTSWFYFAVEGGRADQNVIFRIMNSNPHQRLYDLDMRPVFRAPPAVPEWQRVPYRPVHQPVAGKGVLSIPFVFPASDCRIEVAFTYPYPLENVLRTVSTWEAKARALPDDIYFHRERALQTVDRMPVDVITLSSLKGLTGAEPGTDGFGSRKFCFISARVHPGEVPASFILDGLMNFLLSDEPAACALREGFVFKVIPVLNPDGVRRGYNRNDTRGRNLNRFYDDPSAEDCGSVALAKELFLSMHSTGRLAYYVDLHAHHSKRGAFFYGNNIDDDKKLQADVQLLGDIFAHLSPHFDPKACNYSKANMGAKDTRGQSKEGSARVALYRQTGFAHTYTLECNYNTSNLTSGAKAGGGVVRYTPPVLESIGRALALSFLVHSGNAAGGEFLSPEALENMRAKVLESVTAKPKPKGKKRVPQAAFMKAARASSSMEAKPGVMIF